MVEVEIKFPAPPGIAFEPRLLALGATFLIERQESDQYLNAPDRDFAKTDEALRIRRVGADVKLTYKGPKRDLLTKTRTEIEVPLASIDQGAQNMSQLLASLGYRPSGTVQKQRRVYQLALEGIEAEICLDQVAGLGAFVELEIVVQESQVESARDALLRLAAQLSLEKPERRSYLELILARGAADV